MSSTHCKSDLRTQTLERIASLTPEDRHRQEAAIFARFEQFPGLSQANTVLLYISALAGEIDTRPLVRLCLKRAQRVVLPRIDRRQRLLVLFEIHDFDQDLQPGPLGIPEPGPLCREISPDRVDWVLVPGVAYDWSGNRLGRGGGYYDRLLPSLPTNTPRWAMAYTEQIYKYIPTSSHDIPISGIIHSAGVSHSAVS